MNCEDCEYKVLDHYVDGSPTAAYACGHPEALETWARYDGERCPAEVKETD